MHIKRDLLIILTVTICTGCIKQNNSDYSYNENFDLLWHIVDEKYCYFDEKEINWDSIGNTYRGQISEKTDSYSFFSICTEMLDELKDGHTGISSPFNAHSYSDFYITYAHNFNYNIIERHYLAPQPIISGGMRAQKIDNTGYIYYGSFMAMTGRKEIQAILHQLGDINGLIIDIRNNVGGMIALADTIASCFVHQDTIVGYTKYKEGPEHDNFSDFYAYKIGSEDSSNIIYDGNIAVLTNRKVYSAANTFASIMQALPNVTLLGDTTGGGGGMPTSSKLYNGWQVWMSTNPMFNIKKKSIENGVAPDIRIDITKDDEYNEKDAIIDAAASYLKSIK